MLIQTQTENLKQALIQRGEHDLPALADAFELVRNSTDKEGNLTIRNIALKYAMQGSPDGDNLYKKTLAFAAPYDFDSFMLWNEIRRPPEEQFWLPRRSKLLGFCHALQDMADGNLDELFLSCPPRIGKSTLVLLFMLWNILRDSEKSNLYCSYTDSVAAVFYTGLLEILQDTATYAWNLVFPESKVVSTNAKDLLINIDRKKRYASFTGRSLYGTLNGAVDCNGICIADDLISGIDEALSDERLKSAWLRVDNNYFPRGKEGCKHLWIGTRWSINDPMAKRIGLIQNDSRYKSLRWKVINVPALNKNNESNFEYAYGVGFSTGYFQERFASFERNNDTPSWMAQYQGEPIERNGSVFRPDHLRYYNGILPDVQPDRVFIAIDPSWGGGDFTAGPVVFQYEDDLFVQDVIYTNGDKRVSQAEIVHSAIKYKAGAIIVETTKTTAEYREDIDQMLRDQGVRISVQSSISHWINTKNKDVKGKQQRIFDYAPEIRERMLFLEDGHRSKQYAQFMQNLYAFTVTGKNKNDDAPDSLCIAISATHTRVSAQASVVRSPF